MGNRRGPAPVLSATARRRLVAVTGAVVLAPRAALAHGAGGATDGLSTALLIGAGAVVWWFKTLKSRSERARRLRWWLTPAVALLVLGALTATIWGPKPKPAKNRPSTAARLAILAPEPNAVTGPDVTVRLRLDGGRIVPQSQANGLVPDGGHVHTYVDGRLVSMVDGLEQQIRGLAPGPHTIRTEFVAADHGPFKNPVVAAVVFEVQA
jgi:hypothetical protein